MGQVSSLPADPSSLIGSAAAAGADQCPAWSGHTQVERGEQAAVVGQYLLVNGGQYW